MCFYCLFIEMEGILLRYPTYVNGSSLAEIVKIENKGCEIKIMLTEDLIGLFHFLSIQGMDVRNSDQFLPWNSLT